MVGSMTSRMMRACTAGVTTGIGPLIIVQQALVILAAGHGQGVAPIAHDDEAGFFAFEKFFDDDFVAGITKAAAQHGLGRSDGFIRGLRHDYTLARSKAAGFHHDGRRLRGQPCTIEILAGELAIARCWNSVALQELLGEHLGAFELRRCLARAKAGQAARGKVIDDSCHQRPLGADDGELNAFCCGEVSQLLHLLHADGHIAHLGFACSARIAGRNDHFGDARRLRALPRQCMLAAAAADDEYLVAFCVAASHEPVRRVQCLKCRMPVKSMARFASSAAAMTSASRIEPPG